MIPVVQLALVQLSAADELCSFWTQTRRSPHVLQAASGLVRGCRLVDIPVSDARLSAPKDVWASSPRHRHELLTLSLCLQRARPMHAAT